MNPPFHIPFAVKIGGREQLLSVTKPEETFTFKVAQKPVPSLLRGFSAPVILEYPYTEDELLGLMAGDDDPFNRWEAAQRLMSTTILERHGVPSAKLIAAARNILAEKDPAFVAEALSLPPESSLAEQMAVVDPEKLHEDRNSLKRALASSLASEFSSIYHREKETGPYSPDAKSIGKRSLKNLCLGYLAEIGQTPLAYAQFRAADNMTDVMAALACLANNQCPERQPALDAFYEKWRHDDLVVDKWLAVQATSRLTGTLARVNELLHHPAFDLKVPNKVYALIRAFGANHVRFHAADGAGYAFMADQVIALDALNPQVAARIARSFDRWKRFDSSRMNHSKRQLERIRDYRGLSSDVAEIVTKTLAG